MGYTVLFPLESGNAAKVAKTYVTLMEQNALNISVEKPAVKVQGCGS